MTDFPNTAGDAAQPVNGAAAPENNHARGIGDRPVVLKALADLRPYDRNARTHSDEQIAQIIASINEWGWTNPVLIDEAGMILAGHGRVMAAAKMGLAEVPCIVIAGLSDAQKRAYVIADNKLALNAGWDEAALREELKALADLEFNLDLTGFEAKEVEFLAIAAIDPPGPKSANGALALRFGIPPFTVLNAREGWWQDRKRAWLALGIQSELGRGADGSACPGGSPLPGKGPRANYQPGVKESKNG